MVYNFFYYKTYMVYNTAQEPSESNMRNEHLMVDDSYSIV